MLGVLSLVPSTARAQKIYKHVDAQGRVTFSTAPTDQGSKVYETKAGATHATGAPKVSSGSAWPLENPDGDGVEYHFEYDPVGNLTKVVTPDEEWEYEYSPDRELIDQEVYPRP